MRKLDLDLLLGQRHKDATFHDAVLERIEADYATLTASLRFNIPAGVERGDLRYQRGTLFFDGLLFLAVESPAKPYSRVRPAGAWITADGPFPDPNVRSSFALPESFPEEAFAHYFFASDWNSFIFIGARSVSFRWAE